MEFILLAPSTVSGDGCGMTSVSRISKCFRCCRSSSRTNQNAASHGKTAAGCAHFQGGVGYGYIGFSETPKRLRDEGLALRFFKSQPAPKPAEELFERLKINQDNGMNFEWSFSEAVRKLTRNPALGVAISCHTRLSAHCFRRSGDAFVGRQSFALQMMLVILSLGKMCATKMSPQANVSGLQSVFRNRE